MADDMRIFKAREETTNAEVTVEIYPDGSFRIYAGDDDTIDLNTEDTERLRRFLNGRDV